MPGAGIEPAHTVLPFGEYGARDFRPLSSAASAEFGVGTRGGFGLAGAAFPASNDPRARDLLID